MFENRAYEFSIFNVLKNLNFKSDLVYNNYDDISILSRTFKDKDPF